MKSMEKLDVLRGAGADQRLAEAIVRTQEASDYVTKDYLDARLGELEARLVGRINDLLVKLLLAMVGVAGVTLAVARILFG